MKRMKFLNGIGAMFALAVVALATTLTSCEKEDFNVNVEPINAQATINTTVLYVDETSTTNVTNDPTTVITYSEGPTFTGNPGLSAKEVTVTASYNGITNTAKVSVPALQAGQYLTLSTTIILQKDAPAPVNAKAEIKPVVLYVADGVTTDVTDKAEIVFDPANDGVFEGNPELAATLSKITATYEGVSATISVEVPALAAGQSATMSPTIILQKQVGNARVEVKPVVLYMTKVAVIDVTASAEIVFDPANNGIFEGTPAMEATTSKITATYNDIEGSVTVNIPALAAGQYTTLTPTILLVEPSEPIVSIEVKKKDEIKDPIVKIENLDNETDFWWNETVTYTDKGGSKIVNKNILTTDFDEISKIGGFISTLEQTYKEEQVTRSDVPVYSHSRTIVTVEYAIVKTDYTFSRVSGSEKEVIATVSTEEYSTLFEITPSQQIPGHGHAPAGHGHGYDHGHGHGTGNAGGGIVIPD